MTNVEDLCRDVVTSLDGAVAFGVIDLASGVLLASHQDPGAPPVLGKTAAAVLTDLLRGPHVTRLEQLARARRPSAGASGPLFNELHVTSENTHHFSKRINGGRAAVVLVTRGTTSIGMAWAQLKSAIPRVEAQLL